MSPTPTTTLTRTSRSATRCKLPSACAISWRGRTLSRWSSTGGRSSRKCSTSIRATHVLFSMQAVSLKITRRFLSASQLIVPQPARRHSHRVHDDSTQHLIDVRRTARFRGALSRRCCTTFNAANFSACKRPLLDPYIASGPYESGGSFRLELQDLSLGGVALKTADARFGSLESGTVLRDVTLQLGSFGTLRLDLEIVAPRLVDDAEGRSALRDRLQVRCRLWVRLNGHCNVSSRSSKRSGKICRGVGDFVVAADARTRPHAV